MGRIDDRERLIERLRAAGLDEADIASAAQQGRLPTLAVELALGGRERHTLSHVARESGLSTAFLRELMQAVGRPNPGRGERAYTDQDVEFARGARTFTEAGLSQGALLEIGRVTSMGMANTADAVRRLAGEALLAPGDSEETVGLRFAEAADRLVPIMSQELGNHFRTHLRDNIRRQLLTEEERRDGKLHDTRDVAIGFADLVDYTKLGERLPPEDVGQIAGRLAEIAAASVRRPVLLVKTLGDAAMFVSPDTDALLHTCARLVAGLEQEGEDFPAVRVGVAWGPAIPRGGDWFGGPVNVASRVTGVAKPGTVYATEAVRERTSDREWKRKRKRNLRGVDGRVRLFALDGEKLARLS
jgi:adenylate cyclase